MRTRLHIAEYRIDKNERIARVAERSAPFRLDEDTINYFRRLAEESGIPYQSLINLYLREYALEKRKLRMKWVS